MNDTNPDDNDSQAPHEKAPSEEREPEEDQQQPTEEAAEEPDDTGPKKKRRKLGHPLQHNPLTDMLADIHRRNAQILSNPLVRITDQIDERNRRLLSNPTQKLIQDIHRRNTEALFNPLVRMTDQLNARNRALLQVPTKAFEDLATDKAFMDNLLSTARTQADSSRSAANWALNSNVSGAIRRAAQTQRRNAEEALEKVEALQSSVSEYANAPSDEVTEKGRATEQAVRAVVDANEGQDNIWHLILQEIQQQGVDNAAQWKVSTIITALALLVAVLALLGSLPQGVAAIPQAQTEMTTWSFPWRTAGVVIVVGALIAWGIVAVRNSQYEADADRNKILAFLLQSSSRLSGAVAAALRWARLKRRLPHESE